ncbi:MAG: DUF2490 domain-containing protein [Bacteroidetes bacterium]|nr:DUF2490 domain-containing protein [Bacteroidota bacterium]
MKKVLHLRNLVLALVACPVLVFGQTKTVKNAQQVWFGYMTTTKLNNQYSLWNDFHYVPNGFFIARTGLTRNFTNGNFTAGYSFLLIPVNSSITTLKRVEHRPWAQAIFTVPLSKSVLFIQRSRYEARFRQNVKDTVVTDGYVFTNRVRFFICLKKTFMTNKETYFKPFVSVGDEVLINFGKNITYNTFDQNRIFFTVGVQRKNISYQIGYMNRFVQTGTTQYTLNHTILFWVTHNFSWQRKTK